MKEAMSAGVLVGIAEGQLVADRVLLQKAEGVSDANVVVCPGKKPWTIEVRSEHHEQVRACAGLFLGRRACIAVGRAGRLSAQIQACTAQDKRQKGEQGHARSEERRVGKECRSRW